MKIIRNRWNRYLHSWWRSCRCKHSFGIILKEYFGSVIGRKPARKWCFRKKRGFLIDWICRPHKRLERRSGGKYAQDLYGLSAEGIEIVRRRCQNSPQTEIDAEPGILRMSWGKKENNLNAEIDYMNSIYETKLTYWSKSKVAEHYSSRKYSDAIFNPDAYQLHSLNYIHKCAVDAESLGAKIF